MPNFNSSAINRAEYDPTTRRLTIWFKEGKPYDFCNVPQHIYEGLCRASSHGDYYHQHIAGRYHC